MSAWPPSATPVRLPVMLHQWRHVTFLHWRYPPDVIQAVLPPGLTVETCDGTGWLSLLPFRMEGLPYCWSDMAVEVTGPVRQYRCRRRWPGPARCDARVHVGDQFDVSELRPLDHFLTARFRLYSRLGGRLIAADAEHQPWSLHHAELADLVQNLAQVSGLPAPDHDPLVHFSPGVTVRVGMWRLV